MKKECPECRSKDLHPNPCKGESICKKCGLVFLNYREIRDENGILWYLDEDAECPKCKKRFLRHRCTKEELITKCEKCDYVKEQKRPHGILCATHLRTIKNVCPPKRARQ